MPQKSWSVASSRTTRRRHVLEAAITLLSNAEREGLEISETWNGESPAWSLNGEAMGWDGTVSCLRGAAEQAQDPRALALTHNLYPKMKEIVPSIAIVAGCRLDADNDIRGGAERLYPKLRTLGRIITVIACKIKDAMAEARVGVRKETILRNDPVFLARVYNKCFIDINMWFIIEDLAKLMYQYWNSYTLWMLTLGTIPSKP
jgi:hypothetical protein